MSENWFYRVFDEEFGPVSLDDLREFVKNGTLSGNDDVRPEALTIWVPAKAVRELQDLYQEAIESSSSVTSVMNAAAATPAATDEWYYRVVDGGDADAEVGPVTFDALVECGKSGRFAADDEVRLGVDGKWRRAGSMGRLVAVLPFQTRRRNVAPVPVPESQADLLKEMISALPEVASETDSETPAVERKTPRPKSASREELTSDSPRVRTKTRPKSRPADKQSILADLEKDIEDQILEELMKPGVVGQSNQSPGADSSAGC